MVVFYERVSIDCNFVLKNLSTKYYSVIASTTAVNDSVNIYSETVRITLAHCTFTYIGMLENYRDTLKLL